MEDKKLIDSFKSVGGMALGFMGGMASVGGVALAFVGGVTLGAVTGTVGALLLAPQSGRESRATVRHVARRVGGDVRDFSGKATDTLCEVMNKGRELLSEAETVVKGAMEVGRESVQQMRNSSSEESDSSR